MIRFLPSLWCLPAAVGGRNAKRISVHQNATLGKSKLERVRRRFNDDLHSSWLCISASKGTTRVLVWVGRVLLILTTVSLLTAPLTQHLWTWDHFLHGGQDFELHTLVILTFLCLVLVLCKQLKWSADVLLEGWLTLQHGSRAVLLSQNSANGTLVRLRLIPVAAPASPGSCTPLQI